MNQFSSYYKALRDLLIFAFPVILGQLGQMLIGAGDVWMATKHSTDALAAIGIAVGLSNPVLMLGIGLQFAVAPIIAKKRGEGEDGRKYALSAIAFSLILSIPLVVINFFSAELVDFFDYGPIITPIVKDYIRIVSLGFPGLYLYIGLKEYLQAHERTFFANMISLFAVVLNIGLGMSFMFGYGIIPSMGVNGLAWASIVVRWLSGLIMVWFVLKDLQKSHRVEKKFMKEVFTLGLPIAVTIFMEVLAFCSVALLVGKFGTIQAAANNLVLTLASVAFMVPLALSSAVAVKVGHGFGEKNWDGIKIYARSGLLGAIGYAIFSASLFALFPHFVLGLFSPDEAVMESAIKMIFWVAIFQLFDGIQVILSGILRGINISRITSVVNLIGYWVIGLPLGYVLAHQFGFQGQGFWMGLAISLCVVAVSLSVVAHLKVMGTHE